MSKRDSNFFEAHIEKIVLAIVVLGCLWLFVTRVLFSPIKVEYDNEKFSSRTIDNRISEQAASLENKVNRNPEPKQPYQPRVDDFIARLNSAISDINVNLSLPQPIMIPEDQIGDREYHIPSIGEVNDVLAEHIRTVAYVPNGEVTDKNVYDPDNSEPNDIDFVTVEAKFDVSGLYKRFNASFDGENVKPDWRDPRLAKPVFAAVQLQRQQLLSDGSWSDWQTVPRSKVDRNKRMLEIIEDVADLPAGGIKVRMLQFDDAEVRVSILQPETYHIASAKEEWFPPSLHEEYLEYQKEIDVMKRREVAAGRKMEREGERSADRRRQTAVRTRPTTEATGGLLGGEMEMYSNMSTTKTLSRKSQPERKSDKERPQKSKEVSKTIDDIYRELAQISIAGETDLARVDKPLQFWAYDDTVEPGKYRYRIRLGVFNPIAGTNQFSEQDRSLKNKVILWSKFSETTEPVEIPGKLYFFPRDIQEATKVVTVQVSRYVLGYWYSKDFMVKQGELIGKIDEYRITADEESKQVTVPQTVDYTTGAVVVDIVPVTDWSGVNSLRVNHFFDMLYSYNGSDINRRPIRSKYWTDELQNKYNEIKKDEKEPKEPLRSWVGRAGGPQPRQRITPQYGEDGMPMD